MKIIAHLAAGLALAALAADTAPAADATWNFNNPGNWANGTFWTPAAAPGSTASTTSPDTATFGTINTYGPLAVTVDSNRNIKTIDFAGNSFAYWLYDGSLLLTDGGVIQTSGDGSSHTNIISAPITLEGNGGSATFTSGSSTTGRSLSISNAVTGVSTSEYTTTLTLNGAHTGGTNTGASIIAGSIGNGPNGGDLRLIKDNPGTWALAGTNTFTGGLKINMGELRANSSSALGGSGTGLVELGDMGGSSNATLSINCNGVNNPITVLAGGSGTLMISNMTQAVLGGSITVNNNLSLFNGANTLSLNGKIAGSGTITSDQSGSNAPGRFVQFTGVNTGFYGNVVIHSGYFRTQSPTALNASNTVTMYAGTIFGVNTVTIAGLNDGAGGAGSAIVTNANPANNTLTLGGVGSYNFSGAIVDGANGGVRTISLVKSGVGTQTLAGTNTYTGGTTISNGELHIVESGSVVGNITNNSPFAGGLTYGKSGSYLTTNTITGAGGMTVKGGGTNKFTGGALGGYTGTTTVSSATALFDHTGTYGGLVLGNGDSTVGGTGRVNSVTMNAGSTLSPGNSVGTLTITNSLTLNGNINVFELAAGTNDQVVVQSQMTMTNAPTLRLVFSASFTNGQFLLFNNDFTGNSNYQPVDFFLDNENFVSGPSQLAEGTAFLAKSGNVTNNFKIYYHADGLTPTGGNDIMLSAIPEPSGVLALLGGGAALAARYRIRRSAGPHP
ncbi:MAG: autotransporter-associated beta strand repeat-containing protein, partial [Kiritimatiellaeota bacterium]|nr:autotransporter-associated beta strand repeat-containing protein [Kiritimatiellota bacterium]